MSLSPNYYLKFSDPSRDPIVVLPGKINNDTTLTLFGRNIENWGVYLNENLVKLLENYCNEYPPGYANQVCVGQFWYNSNTKELNLCVSTDPLEWKVICNRHLDQFNNILLKTDIPNHLSKYIPLNGNKLPTDGPIYVADVTESTNNLSAVNKKYVDNLVCVCGIYNVDPNKFIKLSGDTITAKISVLSDYTNPLYAATPEFISNYTHTSVYTKKLSLTNAADINYTEIDKKYSIFNEDGAIITGGYDGAIVYMSGNVKMANGSHSKNITIPELEDIFYVMTSGHVFDNAEATLTNSDNACGTEIPTEPCDTYHSINANNSITVYRNNNNNAGEVSFILNGLAKGMNCRSCKAKKSYGYIMSCDKAKNASKFPINNTTMLVSSDQVLEGDSWTLPTTASDIPAGSVITVVVDGVAYTEGVNTELSVTGSKWTLTLPVDKQLPSGQYSVITSRSIVQGPLPDDCYSTVYVNDATSSGDNLWFDIGVYNNRRYFVLNKKLGEKTLIWSSLSNTTSAIGTYDGLYNSNAVLVQTKKADIEYPAINFCKNVNIGGFNDWYLPAVDELKFMLTGNSLMPGDDALDTSATYWSSSEKTNNDAISVDMSSGTAANSDKQVSNLVRAIRSVMEPVTAGSTKTGSTTSGSTIAPTPTPELQTSIDENVSGGAGETIKEYSIKQGGGVFSVDYDMQLKPDAMYIYVNGKQVASTGTYVAGKGTLTVPGSQIPDNATIKVRMVGSNDGTAWSYKINYSKGIKSNEVTVPTTTDPGGIVLSDPPNPKFVISKDGGDFYGTYDECANFIKKLNTDKFSGHNDWVIPKKSDLDVMANHVDDTSISGTLTSYYNYWSNESAGTDSYNTINLYDKKWSAKNKSEKCMVRAIRYV